MEPGSTPRTLVQKKKTWKDSLPIDMLLSAVSVLVVVQSSSEIPEGLMNNPVYIPQIYINKIQQYAKDAGIYLLQNYSTCFGCLHFDVLLMMGAIDTRNV